MYQFAGTFFFPPEFELVATDGIPVPPATVIGRENRREATEGIGTSGTDHRDSAIACQWSR